MPSPLSALEDLLATLFTDAELRRFVARLEDGEKLARSLPGGNADLAHLAYETAGLLKRRGRVDAALMAALADQAGADRVAVGGVAALWGLALPKKKAPLAEPAIDLFIAHAGPDKAVALQLAAALKAQGIVPFMDTDLLPGDNWDQALPAGLARSKVVAILVGATYDAAYYLRDEVQTALAYARADATAHRAVPIYLAGAPTRPDQVPYGLRVRNCLDWPALGGASGVAAELARLFSSASAAPNLGASAPPAPPPTLQELVPTQRYDVLIRLLPALFEEIQFRAGAASADLPPATAALSTRALSLVQWLDVQKVEARLRFDALLRVKAPGLFE